MSIAEHAHPNECPTCGTLIFKKVYDRFRICKGVNRQTGKPGFVMHYRSRYVDDAPNVRPSQGSVFLLTREGAEAMREMLKTHDGGPRLSRDMLKIFQADKERDANRTKSLEEDEMLRQSKQADAAWHDSEG